nr:MAG TPA: peptidase [Caudoviricetes sp.]
MSMRAGTVPLSDLQFIKIYFNRKRLRSTTANLKKMLAEAGGDAICNGSIFLRDQTPACHLKADGKVYKAPNYRAWGISWDTPADFGVKTVPNGDANYMECVHLIIGGKKINPIHCGADMRYRAPRTAIGAKNGRFAYYVSKARRSPEQLRNLLAASGWDNAIMMDGGGSTCFMDSTGKGITGDGRVIPFFLVWKYKSSDAFEPEGEKPMVEINAYSKAKDGGKKLSTNFTVKEFACKDGSDAVLVAPRLVMVLQSIRSHFGAAVTINSAYRTPQYNAKVGGVAHSQHCYGTAADIVVRGKTPAQVAAYVRQLMPDWGGVGVYDSFCHIDVREAKADWKG